MFSATTLFVSVALCLGQTDTNNVMPDTVRQVLEQQFLGDLTIEGTFGGKPFAGEETWRWASDRSTAIIEGVIVMDGAQLPYTSVAGWEASGQVLVVTGFFSGGDVATTRWSSFSADGWKGRIVGTFEGRPYESSAQIEFKPDSMRYEDTTDGKQWISVAKRKATPQVVPRDQHEIPDAVAKELDYFVGDWTIEGNIGGKSLQGQWCARWAPQKHCLLTSSILDLGGEKVSTNGVSGWDAAAEQIVTVQSVSNGVIEDARYKIAAPGVLKGIYTISATGGPLKVDCEVVTKQPNEWTFQSSANIFAGEAANDFTLRLVRSEAGSQSDQVASPVYEHLKDLEAYVGEWVAEDTMLEDAPGFAAKGEKVKYRASVNWARNKAIMQMDFVMTAPNGTCVDACWHLGWDSAKNTIVYSGFDSLGGRVWGETKKNEVGDWTWKNEWCDPSGKQGSGVGTTKMLDNNDTHIHAFTDCMFNGQPQPDGQLVYMRLK